MKRQQEGKTKGKQKGKINATRMQVRIARTLVELALSMDRKGKLPYKDNFSEGHVGAVGPLLSTR